jgi:hypothetical protein
MNLKPIMSTKIEIDMPHSHRNRVSKSSEELAPLGFSIDTFGGLAYASGHVRRQRRRPHVLDH